MLLSLTVSLMLAGCQNGAERADAQDDAYCRRTIVERNDGRPNAYQECRANMMGYRTQQAIRASGDVITVQR